MKTNSDSSFTAILAAPTAGVVAGFPAFVLAEVFDRGIISDHTVIFGIVMGATVCALWALLMLIAESASARR